MQWSGQLVERCRVGRPLHVLSTRHAGDAEASAGARGTSTAGLMNVGVTAFADTTYQGQPHLGG